MQYLCEKEPNLLSLLMEPVLLFISYSERDFELKDRIKELLTPLVNNHSLSIWDELDINAGEVRSDIISSQLNTADIILLLLSSSSLANREFYYNQLSTSLIRHHERKALIVPVLLGLCHYDITPLEGLQLLPKNQKPVAEQNIQQALFEVTLYIKEKVLSIQKRKTFLLSLETAERLFGTRKWSQAKKAFHELEQKYPYKDFPEEIRHIKQRIEACETKINTKPPVTKKEKKPSEANSTATPKQSESVNDDKKSLVIPSLVSYRNMIFGIILTGVVLVFASWYMFQPPKKKGEEIAIENARKEDRLELWLKFKAEFPKSKYMKQVARGIERHNYRSFFLNTLERFSNHPGKIDLTDKLLKPSLEKFPEDSLFYFTYIKPN